MRDTVALGTAHPYKFLETVKKATGENVEAPHQLEKFIDKDEKFDIVGNNNEKIKYKNVIRNLHYLDILQNTKSGLYNTPSYLQVLLDLYNSYIIFCAYLHFY